MSCIEISTVFCTGPQEKFLQMLVNAAGKSLVSVTAFLDLY